MSHKIDNPSPVLTQGSTKIPRGTTPTVVLTFSATKYPDLDLTEVDQRLGTDTAVAENV